MISTPVALELDHPDLLAGVIEAKGITVGPSDEVLDDRLQRTIDGVTRGGESPPDNRKGIIRDLLRRGGFKPAGRNKPASEYLAACAQKGSFPRINNIVDINNLVSLRYGLPASVVDIDLALQGTDRLVIRFGAEKESYLFNPSGQEIDVGGLICLARYDGAALANAVKDSMTSKTCDETTNVLAVIYASCRTVDRDELSGACALFAELFRNHAAAAETAHTLLPGSNLTEEKHDRTDT